MASTTTLAVDFGAKYIGLALVRNQDGKNVPLFAFTLAYDRFTLSKKAEPRVQMRRMRRTKKSKKARLRWLEAGLLTLGLDQETVDSLVRFCRRRGYKSLFDEPEEPGRKKDKEEEEVFRYSREEFFQALEKQVEATVPEDKRVPALYLCEHVLNREGDRFKEVRLIRIDNRGVSRCAWDGCNGGAPRRDNALKDALAQVVFTVYAQHVRDNPEIYQELQGMLERVAELGKRLRHAAGPRPEVEKKILRKRIGQELKVLKGLSGLDEEMPEETVEPREAWAYIRRGLMNLIERSGGRNRFCHQHSEQYVSHLLEGKPIPFKKSLTEADITSRREEILFQKLWRYIEARVLPLAPKGVDRVVVERTAFDLLAGTRKQRLAISDKELEAMYQEGPRHGFKDDLEMLREEFGGLCAYCGQPSSGILEREHILPQADFFFDSYLNKVPACIDCNRLWKGKASPLAAGLVVHESAFQAYSRYLSAKFAVKNRPPHVFHTIKKGILKLMTQKERLPDAERLLAIIADNLGTVVEAQRGPRPLARYLCQKLGQRYGRVLQVAFRSGRHTSIWRQAAYPEFDKAAEKTSGGTLNHALDALIMACDLPDITFLEARNLAPWTLGAWVENVQAAAPPPGENGVPALPFPAFAVPGFEEVLPGNYVQTDLARFNWNRRDSRVQRQDAYGWDGWEDVPAKRVSAADLAASLRAADKKTSSADRQVEVKKEIEVVVHPRLRQALEKANAGDTPGEAAAQALTRWLRKAVKGSLGNASFSSHPADQGRAGALRDFAQAVTEVIPAVIGVRIRYPWLKANMDLHRVDRRTGKVVHRYVADPANRGFIVAYMAKDAQVQRDKPLTLELRQSGAVAPGVKKLGEVPPGPLQGRAFGEPRVARDEWDIALKAYLQAAGIIEYTFVSQGYVIHYEDGSQRYIRNFSSSYGFKKSLFKGIIGVRHSPLAKRVTPNTRI
jgi:hypothetical protein